MRLNEHQRLKAFTYARSLSGDLGAPFQNDVDLTPEDLQREVDEVKELQDRLSTYHIRLLTMKAKATKETK